MSANTPILRIGQNTTRPELTHTLTDQNGQAINLVDASEVRLTTRHHRTGLIETDGQPVDIVAPQGGEVRYQFAPEEIPLGGRYDAQFLITYENGDTRAVPAASEWFPFISVARNLPQEKMAPVFSSVRTETFAADRVDIGLLGDTLNANGNRITGLPYPNADDDATPRSYVDEVAGENITGLSNPAVEDFNLNGYNIHNAGDIIWTAGRRPIIQFNPDQNLGSPANALIEFRDNTDENTRYGWFGWLAEDAEMRITNLETGDDLGVGSPTNINGNEIWHEGNDGDGSGLDADTVDGQDAGQPPTVATDGDAPTNSFYYHTGESALKYKDPDGNTRSI